MARDRRDAQPIVKSHLFVSLRYEVMAFLGVVRGRILTRTILDTVADPNLIKRSFAWTAYSL